MSMEAPVKMNETRSHKVCKGSCGRLLPREMFRKKGVKGDTRYPYCDDCWHEYVEYRRANKLEPSRRRERRRRTGSPCDREPLVWLETSRVWAWIQTLPGSEDEIAMMLGTTTRQLFRWRTGEADTVSLDYFDRCLCHAEMPWVLREVFPELFRWDDEPEFNLEDRRAA